MKLRHLIIGIVLALLCCIDDVNAEDQMVIEGYTHEESRFMVLDCMVGNMDKTSSQIDTAILKEWCIEVVRNGRYGS